MERRGEVEYREGTGSEWTKNKKVRSLNSRGSTRRGSYYASVGSLVSKDRLSSREVGKIKMWVVEKEREDRKSNIVKRDRNVARG